MRVERPRHHNINGAHKPRSTAHLDYGEDNDAGTQATVETREDNVAYGETHGDSDPHDDRGAGTGAHD